MQEKEDQKVVFVSLSIHTNLEHEEHTQKTKKKKNPDQPTQENGQPNTLCCAIDDCDGFVGHQFRRESQAVQRCCIEQYLHDEQWMLHLVEDQRVSRDLLGDG